MADQLRFTGTSVVTGAVGIGAAVAQQLVGLGTHIVAVDVDTQGLERPGKAPACRASGLTAVTADVREQSGADLVRSGCPMPGFR